MLTPGILARARYLHERLQKLSEVPATSEGLTKDLSRRSEAELDRLRRSNREADLSRRSEAEADFLFWKQQFSSGNYDRFAERLHSLGITEQQALSLTQESWLSDQPINRVWSEILERALRRPALHLKGAKPAGVGLSPKSHSKRG